MSLRYAVLGIIQNKPQHGYEIKQAIEESFGDMWNVSYGQLYPTLKNLTEKGYVTKHKEQGQKSIEKNVYKITDTGRILLQKWLDEIPKKINISGKDEFSLLILLFMLEGKKEKQYEAVEKQRKYFVEIKNKYSELYNNAKGPDFARKLLLRRIILRVEAELMWLEELQINTVEDYP